MVISLTDTHRDAFLLSRYPFSALMLFREVLREATSMLPLYSLLLLLHCSSASVLMLRRSARKSWGGGDGKFADVYTPLRHKPLTATGLLIAGSKQIAAFYLHRNGEQNAQLPPPVTEWYRLNRQSQCTSAKQAPPSVLA